MAKSAEAFRTISEVADYLETPAHVLRFWESRFTQIRPVKRAGGRRYYRPADMALLSGIKKLLHDDGLTIRGVQKILKERGIRHVADLGGMPFSEDHADSPAMAEGAGLPPDVAAPEMDMAGKDLAGKDLAGKDLAEAARRDPADDATGDLFAAARPAPRADAAPGAAMRAAMGRYGGQPAKDPPRPPMDTEAPEAPMDVDVPTLPAADTAGTLHSFAPQIARPAPPAPAPAGPDAAPDPAVAATTDQQPAAAMLRAMDALRAREKKTELKSVYLRLSDLRNRLARGSTPPAGD